MTFMDKIFFWKKEERPSEAKLPEPPVGPGLSAKDIRPPPAEQPPGLGAPDEMNMPEPSMPEMREPRMGPSMFGSHERPSAPPLESAPRGGDEHSLMMAKLDTIKAQLDAVLQRLERMEYAKEDRAYQRRWR